MTERKTQPRITTDHECIQEDRIKGIENGINAISGTALVTDSQLKRLLEDTADMKECIRGANGEIGIVGRLSKVEDAVADMKKLMWIILSVVVTLAIGGLYEVLVRSPSP
jgi:hypothetical protein